MQGGMGLIPVWELRSHMPCNADQKKKGLLKQLQVCRCNRDRSIASSLQEEFLSSAPSGPTTKDTATPPSQLKVGTCQRGRGSAGVLLAQFAWPPRPANKTSLQKDRPPTSSSISLLLLSRGRRQINIFKSQIPGTKNNTMEFSSEAIVC